MFCIIYIVFPVIFNGLYAVYLLDSFDGNKFPVNANKLNWSDLMRIIDGSVTSPEGYFAAGLSCGIKKNGKKDIAIVCSEDISAVAGVFTTNRVKGHSLQVTMEHMKSGYATAIIINSGNANACVGEQGLRDAREIAQIASAFLECEAENILVGSTGVIGVPLDMDFIRPAIDELVSDMSPDGGDDAAEAIMTTDTFSKKCAVDFNIQDRRVVIGGMAKGSGMIHPDMATMISVITTDVNISKSMLNKALRDVCSQTFNRVCVDGETSVCDMCIILANGMADNSAIIKEDRDYELFKDALYVVADDLTKKIAQDGEGATKFVEISVEGALTADDAHRAANAIAKSPLVKTALFGEDANWGRILTAVGYSGIEFDPEKTDIYLENIQVCKGGCAVDFDQGRVSEILARNEISIGVKLHGGEGADRVYTCDLSYDYVKINGSYRT